MQIGQVVGTVTMTVRHSAYERRKLLTVQPHNLAGTPGRELEVCIDTVDAGPGDWVLYSNEGGATREVLGLGEAPVQTMIVAVLEGLSLDHRYGDKLPRAVNRVPAPATGNSSEYGASA